MVMTHFDTMMLSRCKYAILQCKWNCGFVAE